MLLQNWVVCSYIGRTPNFKGIFDYPNVQIISGDNLLLSQLKQFADDVVQPDLTVIEILAQDAKYQSDSEVFTFVQDDGVSDDLVTYRELEQLVTRVARSLQTLSVSADVQDQAILLLPPGKNFVTCFYACLAAGVIAVPSFPVKTALQAERLLLILSDLGNPMVIGDQESLSVLREFGVYSKRAFLIDDLLTERASAFSEFHPSAQEIALLQYTSGSTGSPKGVVITNDNLIENSRLIKQAFGHESGRSRGVMWLPPHHDMGLVGGVVQGVYARFPVMLIPTNVVLRNQYRWLECISRYKANSSGGPNFMFQLCVNNIKDDKVADLDLSHWKVAFCGAEPISGKTIQAFADKFKPTGFKIESLLPCYGMAETTLIVSSKPLYTVYQQLQVSARALSLARIEENKQDAADSLQLVSSGHVHSAIDCKIVDPTILTVKQDSEIGEIWLSGRTVSPGYWNNEKETLRRFNQRLSGFSGEYHRTGDLGFLRDGELYITGRLKEMIIVRGANFYPQDIEHEVSQVFAQFKNCRVVAFSVVGEHGEQLVIAQEVTRQFEAFDALYSEAQARLIDKFGIKPDEFLFLPRKTIKVTSSGKLRRLELKREYELGELVCVRKIAKGLKESQQTIEFNDDSVQSVCNWLRSLIAKKVNVELSSILPDEQFSSLGLDSIAAIDLLFQVETQCGVCVPPDYLYRLNTPNFLAHQIFTQIQFAKGSQGV